MRLDPALGQRGKVGYLGPGKEHGGAVGAGRDAGPAADALGGVHGGIGVLFGDQDGVAVRHPAGM